MTPQIPSIIIPKESRLFQQTKILFLLLQIRSNSHDSLRLSHGISFLFFLKQFRNFSLSFLIAQKTHFYPLSHSIWSQINMVFGNYDAWRSHPMVNPKIRNSFPGLKIAVGVFAVYLAGEWTYAQDALLSLFPL